MDSPAKCIMQLNFIYRPTAIRLSWYKYSYEVKVKVLGIQPGAFSGGQRR